MLTTARAYFQNITKARLVVTTLVLLFSIGSWLGIKATFLEEPLLVGPAPEGWRLPSYLVVITQMGNLGPILYSLIQKFRPIKDAYYIYALLLIGVAGSLVMAFFHQSTAYVFGADRSVAIFVAMFGYALIGCSSSVLFMPYMGRFYEIYLITYIFGVDFSGLVTSVIVIIQGVGGDPECVANLSLDGPAFVEYVPPPRFGVKALFFFVTALMVVSIIAFYLLEKLPICKTEYAAIDIKDGNNFTYADADVKDESAAAGESVKQLSKFNFYYLLIMQAVVCLVGNGILPSIQSFSSLPYGNSTYHLVVTLSTIASPVACFFAFFVPHHSIRQVTALIVFTGTLGAYATVTAIMSPTPPLLDTVAGEILIVSI
jgi:riboflavin transporter 2